MKKFLIYSLILTSCSANYTRNEEINRYKPIDDKNRSIIVSIKNPDLLLIENKKDVSFNYSPIDQKHEQEIKKILATNGFSISLPSNIISKKLNLKNEGIIYENRSEKTNRYILLNNNISIAKEFVCIKDNNEKKIIKNKYVFNEDKIYDTVSDFNLSIVDLKDNSEVFSYYGQNCSQEVLKTFKKLTK